MRREQGQSILEYAILIAVVVVALLIMQVFVKRGYEGGLKDSADKMGPEAFSASGTQIKTERKLSQDQQIQEEVATSSGAFTDTLVTAAGLTDYTVQGTLAKGAHSYTSRVGNQTTDTKAKTDAAKAEMTNVSDQGNTTYTDMGQITELP